MICIPTVFSLGQTLKPLFHKEHAGHLSDTQFRQKCPTILVLFGPVQCGCLLFVSCRGWLVTLALAITGP